MVYLFVRWTLPFPFINIRHSGSSRQVSTPSKEIMNLRHKYSEKQLRDAIDSSYSYRQVLIKLDIVPAGGNYQTLKKRISNLEIDISHFKDKGWSKGLHRGPKRDIQEYLSNKFPIQSYKLKKRLLLENYFDYKCYSCNLEEWLNNPIPLELEHINGNHTDNSLCNLTLLCPNCHAQTSTYRGKNIIS